MSSRLKASGSVIAGYLIGFAPLLLFGSGGLWWAKVMLGASIALALIAIVVSFVFASSVARHPLFWSVCAVGAAMVLSVAVLYFTTGSRVGWASTVVAVPAAVAFYVIARIWLRSEASPAA